MIPLVGGSAALPHVETTGLKQRNIALTLRRPPNQLTSISSSPTISNSFSPGIRILQSRTQQRRSSVSSLCSLLKFEDEEMRKLNSRGSSAGELSLCLETKQLASKQIETNVNLDNSSCSSSDAKEEGEDEDSENCPSSMMPDVAIDNTSSDVNNTEPQKTKSKSRAKSSCRKKSKKHSKSKKSAKKKGGLRTISKAPSVFERLANATQTNNNQEKLSTSSSNTMRKSNTTIFFDQSCASILEVKRLQATYMPVLKPSRPKTLLCLPKVALSRTSNGIKAQSPRQRLCHSVQATKTSHTVISPRKSLDTVLQDNCKNDNVVTKKVYLSEVQSKMISGVPGAPPATPLPDEQARIEFIPCLMDIKSQRAVKTKLEKIVTKLKSEEQQRKENAIKLNQKRLKESLMQLKQQQRAEIYALNKVMTELENQNFRRFMMKQESVSSMGV